MPAETRPCGHCGATENVRPYKDGPCCPLHTPAALAGHPEVVPDPERTIVGILRAHGVEHGRVFTPSSDTLVDARRRASGKKRSSPEAYRAARADVEDRAEVERARRARTDQRERATTGARDGATYVPDLDYARLNGQAKRVFDLMADGKWRTLREIAEATGDPEASVSARLRDFRDQKHGALTAEAERVPGSNLWRYRLLLPAHVSEQLALV